jgi:lipopolysaccharide export LptBFGC system permease protein LptF
MDEAYITKITRWVELDNKMEIRKLKMKDYTEEKKKLEDEILKYIEDNGKQNLQINTSDGFIKFVETKSTSYITLKFLKDTLQSFFSTSKPEDYNAENAYNHILNNRETKNKLSMKRQITS